MADVRTLFEENLDLLHGGPTDDQVAAAREQAYRLLPAQTPGQKQAEVELVDLLRSRRDQVEGALPVTRCQAPGHRETLLVPGDILVRPTPETRERAHAILQKAGYRAEEGPDGCGELSGSLERYHATDDQDPVELLGVVGELKRAGVEAGPRTVMALLTVVKSLSGPTRLDLEPLPPSRYRDPAPDDAGQRRTVAVIDTGIAVRETGKEQDTGRSVPRADGWLNEIVRDANVDPLDVFPAPDRLDFAAGHGTFAAGIVRQIDPEVEIVVYRALDSDGLGCELGIANAMVRAVQEGADVINLSLGMHTYDDQPPVAIEAALDTIDAYLEQHPERERPVFVAAAGNYGDSVPVWPAASRRVISVAGLTPDGDPAEWSSKGVWVDCSTIGEGIVSTFVPGCEDPQFNNKREGDEYHDPAWAMWTGTSFAAPQVSAAIARLSRAGGEGEDGSLSPFEAARRVVRAGVPTPDFGRALKILPGT